MSEERKLKILVIGQGGREHAIVHALAQSSHHHEIHAAPGNHGMAQLATCHDIKLSEEQEILRLCKKVGFDLVILGPEEPAVNGLTDLLRDEGMAVFGPSKAAAQLEGSKVFAKEFMQRNAIPTAKFRVVSSVVETLLAAKNFSAPYVLKADGLAAGKGVYICKDLGELHSAANEIFTARIFGHAGNAAVLEAHIDGWEMSYFFLTNGEDSLPLPIAQDHKRIFESETGPNTGGMGSVAPVPISSSLQNKILERIIRPTLKGLEKEKIFFRGVVFLGLMIKNDEPFVLEYNCRFGDPETQVLLPLFGSDVGHSFFEIARGRIPKISFYKNRHCCCVVSSAEGYPSKPVRGDKIQGLDQLSRSDEYVLHAGTFRTDSGEWLTHGGRVLCAIGISDNLEDAILKAYQRTQSFHWRARHFRKDIGKKIKSSSAD